MFDTPIRKIINPPLNAAAQIIAKTPVTGNGLSITGFLFGLSACLCLVFQYGLYAFGFLVLNRLCDGLDGAVARKKNINSDFGGYLDITLDYLVYAGIPFFAAIGFMDASAFFAAAFVIYSFIASGVTFLAHAIMAAKNNMDDKNHQGHKSFFFARGFMEGAETIIFMGLVCLLPQYFEFLCYGFGILCWITAAARIHMAYQLFRK